MPASAASFRKIASAVGERQMFPIQTRRIFIFETCVRTGEGTVAAVPDHAFAKRRAGKDTDFHAGRPLRRTVTYGQAGDLRRVEMKPGDVFHIPPGTLHRMTGLEDCDILEVSTPELEDVVRLEDRYGRAGTSKP